MGKTPYKETLRGSQGSAPRTYSRDFVTTFGTIVAKACALGYGPDQAVEFAWFSVGQVGDASIDQEDFMRHLGAWVRED